ncbi:MAG: hypothetical protein AB1553_15585 [Nitrospirota bacterium]
MIPLKIRLKGFKGIRSACGVDELKIDLSHLSKGLVAITGPIGSGKTTLLDNLHPYRIMPYRSGDYSEGSFSFYNETYGRDACKELEFLVGDRTYKSVVRIDAQRKSQEAYLFLKDGEEWMVYGDTRDGRLDDYDRAVHELLGSPRGFFTYIFRRQRARELSGYTKGEMKEIFTELLDAEDLKRKAEHAKGQKDALSGTLKELRQEQQHLNEIIAAAPEKEAGLAEIERKLEETETSLRALEEEMTCLNERIKVLEVHITLHRDHEKKRELLLKSLAEKEARAKELDTQLRQKRELYNARHRAVTAKLKEAKERAGSVASLRSAAKDEEALAQTFQSLKEKQAELDAHYVSCSALLTKAAQTETRMEELAKELSTLRLNRSHAKEIVEQNIRRAEEAAEKLGALPCGTTAAAAECTFVKAAVEERRALPSLRKRLSMLDKKEAEEKRIEEQIRALEAESVRKQELEAEVKRCLAAKEHVKISLMALERKLVAIREKMRMLPEAELAERALPLLEQERRELIEEGNRTVEEFRRELSFVERERDDIRKELDSMSDAGGLEEALQKARHRNALVSKATADVRNEQMRLFEKRGRVKEELRQIAAAAGRLAAVNEQITILSKDITEWAFLEKALGNDGLIALEIDDAGPSVAGIANDLIHTCFGGRFSLRIDTQGDRAKGNGTKEIFDIVVFDAERNEQKSLRSMSGGEKILIEAAVKNALCIFNARRSGIPYGTLFTDEEDGGLDAEKKKDFIHIKRRVLELGGYEREFFISHTPEVVALADEVLSMDELAGKDVHSGTHENPFGRTPQAG